MVREVSWKGTSLFSRSLPLSAPSLLVVVVASCQLWFRLGGVRRLRTDISSGRVSQVMKGHSCKLIRRSDVGSSMTLLGSAQHQRLVDP
jgi:hypothetical protein